MDRSGSTGRSTGNYPCEIQAQAFLETWAGYICATTELSAPSASTTAGSTTAGSRAMQVSYKATPVPVSHMRLLISGIDD